MIETLRYATETKAIKEHICNFCGEKIRVGEIYLKSTHKRDELYDWKTHRYCSNLAAKLKMYDYADEGVTHDDFVETISEEFFTILHRMFSKEDIIKYGDAVIQLKNVRWHDKLWYVIRHYKKLEI